MNKLEFHFMYKLTVGPFINNVRPLCIFKHAEISIYILSVCESVRLANISADCVRRWDETKIVQLRDC